MDNEEHQGLLFWIGILVGTALGAIGVMVLSTKEGRKTAKDIWKQTEHVLREWERHMDGFESEFFDKKDQAIEKLTDVKEDVLESAHKELHRAMGLDPSELSSAGGQRYFNKSGKQLS